MEDLKEKSFLEHLSKMENFQGKIKELYFGNDFFGDRKILEFALSFIMTGKDSKTAAKRLLNVFGSFKQVVDAPLEELVKIAKIPTYCACYLNFLKALACNYALLKTKQKNLLTSPQLVSNYLISILGGEDVEKFCMLSLNSSNRLIKTTLLQTGTVNKAPIQPRKVAEEALYWKAVAVILAHNHPGGLLRPSQSDIDATLNIQESLKALEIILHDHIIVADNKYFS
ncbi:MAG: DNA repair protein RadC, partial [Elusimicrobiota bacterium]|nr:DNA repair protein RadC [Elusimicrobiota bacterium]